MESGRKTRFQLCSHYWTNIVPGINNINYTMAIYVHTCPQQDGILVLNKPKGPTSAACIGIIKRKLGQRKIGHAGTLDPMASGVLLVLLGQATKLSGHLMDEGEKVYAGTVLLGQCTDTWDAEGTVLETKDTSHVTQAMLEDAVFAMKGETEQEVPPYSAAKHKGKPLYELARKGLETPVKTKTVRVTDVAFEWVDLPRFRFRVSCGSGTYIRSLAHSLGIRLRTGATLMELTREYSHPFGLTAAHDFNEVTAHPERLSGCVVSIADALPSWPRLTLDANQTSLVRNGMKVPHEQQLLATPFTPGSNALMLNKDGCAVALATAVIESGREVWAVMRGLWNESV